MPMGEGIYQVAVSGQGNGRFKSLSYLRGLAFEKANEFAVRKEGQIEVISVNETPMSYGVFNQVELRFRLVSETEMLATPNEPFLKKSNTYDSKGQLIESELEINSNNKKGPDTDKYLKLKRIGELYLNGILTKEEFEKEKQKILNE